MIPVKMTLKIHHFAFFYCRCSYPFHSTPLPLYKTLLAKERTSATRRLWPEQGDPLWSPSLGRPPPFHQSCHSPTKSYKGRYFMMPSPQSPLSAKTRDVSCFSHHFSIVTGDVKVYPTPGTVIIYCGVLGSGSTFWRK